MDDLVPGCFNCDRQAAATLPPRDDLVRTSSWRVGHAFNVTLPGWLVLAPTRHVTSFAQLSPQACAELGVLTQQLSRALERVTGCVKTYLMQFSEAEGFSHLHVHLVPRLPDHPVHALGPEVFSLMTEDRREWLPEATRDSVALAVRAALDRAGTL